VTRGTRLFTEADLLRLAGPARFERGRSLVDMVDDEYEDEYSLCATVTDDRPYLAMVHHRVGRLAGECDCADSRAPWSFCEHSVAVGLSYLDEYGAPRG
jgi:uncharacterized Zn finger protein